MYDVDTYMSYSYQLPTHSAHLIFQIDGSCTQKKVYFMNEMEPIVDILRDFMTTGICENEI